MSLLAMPPVLCEEMGGGQLGYDCGGGSGIIDCIWGASERFQLALM